MFKKSISVSIVITLVFLQGCSPLPSVSKPQNREDTTAKIIYDGIKLDQKYIGSITPNQESTLSFTLPGRITQIFVEEGDSVKKGDLLASIDSYELEVAASSNYSMVNSLRQLQAATSDMFDAQIQSMEYKLQQVELSKNSVQLSGKNISSIQLGTAELGYLTNVAEFDTTMNLLQQQEFTLYTNAQNAFSQTKVFLEPLGVFLDELFGISSKKADKDDIYDIYLGAGDNNSRNQTELVWQKLNGQYSKLGPKLIELGQKSINNPITETEKQEIYSLLTGTQQFLLETREVLRLAYKTVDASLEDIRYFPSSKINELKQYITIYQANLEKVLLSIEGNYMVGIQGSINNIDAFNKQYTIQQTLLGKKVDIAQNQFSLAKEQLSTQADIIAQQYNEAKEGMKALQKQKDTQIAQLESQIIQVGGQGRQTDAQITKTELLAPYDGIVLKKMIEEGEIANPGVPIISVGSLGQRKVTIQISDKDISGIALNTVVDIYIPALEQTLSGKVSTISPMANMYTRRRDVEIEFTSKQEELPLGSQANVLFPKSTIEGFKVPEQALQTLYGSTTITKINDKGLLEQISVKTLGCNNNACIISGNIEAGDMVRLK